MNLNIFKKLKSPYILLLVGPPLSGKSSFIKHFKENVNNNVNVISRDQIILDIYGSDNYNDAFRNVNQKKVDEVLAECLANANSNLENVIIDMTNMTSKRRKYNLSFFSEKYNKIAVVFPVISDEEYEIRNNKRNKEENKFIPLHVIKSMISNYQTIRNDEGFDEVICI